MIRFLSFICVGLVIIGGSVVQGRERLRKQQNSYDYYVLALEWYGGVCRQQGDCPYLPSTTQSDYQRFGIHGLWPSNFNAGEEDQPSECIYDPFAFKNLSQQMQNQLKARWSGAFNPTENFVAHEYKKHGTCWNADSRIRRQKKGNVTRQEQYFKKVISLADRFDVYSALKGQGVTPSISSVAFNKIKAAIQGLVKVQNFVVKCERDNNVRILSEVRICLDLKYNPIDCDSGMMRGNSCGYQGVAYTPIVF